MIIRVVSRLVLVLATLVLATTLVVGAPSMLASTVPTGVTPLLERDHVSDVKHATKAPVDAEQAPAGSATPVVVLVFAGIVLLAALPSTHRVHLHHRSYHRSDWI
jgi:hypothetical protein